MFLPYDGFGQAALDAALDQLCPLSRPPVYVDDLSGEGRWNHLGIPAGLEEALAHPRAATSQLKLFKPLL